MPLLVNFFSLSVPLLPPPFERSAVSLDTRRSLGVGELGNFDVHEHKSA